jgi:hypothetical protein
MEKHIEDNREEIEWIRENLNDIANYNLYN